MRVLGIDVGVRHFAFCMMDSGFEVVELEVLELGGRTIEDHIHDLHQRLNNRPGLLSADRVVIERQMNTNVKMSCLASALLMYFLNNGKFAAYVEASRKLSAFKDLLAQAKPGSLPAAGYRRTKAQSVMCARFALQGNWLDRFEGLPKKDDAADAFCLAYNELKEGGVQL